MREIYYFTADWCQPCKKTRPIVEELNKEQADAGFQIIDVDSAQDLVKAFNIASVPTFIVFDNGVEIKREIGSKTKDQLWGMIKYEKTIQNNV